MLQEDMKSYSNPVSVAPAGARWPDWVPRDAAHYVHHVELGLSLRELARLSGCHPSTILRQVRRIENRRDDPLVDAALRCLGRVVQPMAMDKKDRSTMSAQTSDQFEPTDDETFRREACRILRSLCEPGALLAVVPDMEKAVVVRDGADGSTRRIAVVDTEIANAMALKNWITCQTKGRIARYRISALGRSEMPRLLSEVMGDAGRGGPGLAEAPASFQGKDPVPPQDDPDRAERRIRYSAPETPLNGLARRRDKSGKPFLDHALVAAGERLREDFELSQMGTSLSQNWERLMTGRLDGGARSDGHSFGPGAARDRVTRALNDLGPGLGDVALRCCCYLEGLESTEWRMGWSARSGKIVLRIALQRLARFYDQDPDGSAMIG